MKLGAFSISLSVKDISASKTFYEKLGFVEFGGDLEQNWLIMKNEDTIIGLFQGMFENNMLTFNPGWNQDAENISEFTDIRKLEETLKSQDVEFISETDDTSEGPANFMILDPDGNPILFDQHR